MPPKVPKKTATRMGAPRGAAKPASELARRGNLVRVSAHLAESLLEVLRARTHVVAGGLRVRVSVSQHIAAAVKQLLDHPPAKLSDEEPPGILQQWWLDLGLAERLDAAYTPARRERAIAAAVERYVRRLQKGA